MTYNICHVYKQRAGAYIHIRVKSSPITVCICTLLAVCIFVCGDSYIIRLLYVYHVCIIFQFQYNILLYYIISRYLLRDLRPTFYERIYAVIVTNRADIFFMRPESYLRQSHIQRDLEETVIDIILIININNMCEKLSLLFVRTNSAMIRITKVCCPAGCVIFSHRFGPTKFFHIHYYVGTYNRAYILYLKTHQNSYKQINNNIIIIPILIMSHGGVMHKAHDV